MGNFTLEKNMNTKVLVLAAFAAFAYAETTAAEKADEAITNITGGSEKPSPRSHWVASMLALSGTGFTGIDRFYLGYIAWGIIKAVTFGGFGIWTLIDQIFITHCFLVDAWGQVMQGCRADQQLGFVEAVTKTAKDTKKAVDDASVF